MDNLYKNYMNSNSKFFKYKESENIYFLDQNAYPNYNIYDDKRHWIYFNYINDVLPVQGFKIHISCLAKDSFELFCILSEFFYSKKLSFMFKGLAGMIFFTKYIDNITLKNKILNKLLIQLDNFICKEYNDYKVLGNYSYRFSDDFYSGSAGLLFALNSIDSKRNILPIF